MKENEEKPFEGELPPSLFEVERRLTGKIDDNSYLPIHALRQARHISQEQLASSLDIEPKQIFQLEQSTYKVLRTLRRYIEAMGGQLDIIACGLIQLSSHANWVGLDTGVVKRRFQRVLKRDPIFILQFLMI